MPRKCIEKGCEKSPIYNYPDSTQRLYCRLHAKDGMRVVGQQYCKEDGCEKYALFGLVDEGVKLYCSSHSKVGMVNLKKPICKYDGCTTQPYYNYPGQTVGVYCATHQLNGMCDVFSKKCLECNKVASFNFPGSKAEYCKEHMHDGMINTRSTTCDACGKQASFAEPGYITPIKCASHKTSTMINLRKKNCTFTGCKKTAVFGVSGNKSFCAEHKDDNMTDNINVKCQKNGCTINASFGIKKSSHCLKHKTPAMKQLVGYFCQEQSCEKNASFNYSGAKPAFCGTHKKTDMVNLNRRKCEKCEKCATFGYPGSSPSFCAEHHTVGTKLQPTKRCVGASCNELALYGTKTALHCDKHKQKNDINLVERICSGCKLLSVLDNTEKCKYCNPSAWTYVRLAKQKEVEALFKAENLEYTSTDTTIDGGECGLERPDFVFEAASHFIVVEVDEDQHKSRACECEQARMVNISQSFGMPTIFLRYNPDNYRVNKVPKHVTKATRHKTLVSWLCKLMVLEPEELQEHGFLSVLHLYFDDFNPRKVQWETILYFD